MNDLTGQRFGRLVALEPTEERYRTSVVWLCRCDCGNSCHVPSDWLRRGSKRSCGCLQDEARRDDIAGKRRGHLTAIRPAERPGNGDTIWEWRCDCGATVYKAPTRVYPSMCPACTRQVKRGQARVMYDTTPRDAETNMVPTNLENLRAGKLFRNNTSGVRGVSWHAASKKWAARIYQNGRSVTLGYYDTIEEAARVRQQAVLRKYGKKEQTDK